MKKGAGFLFILLVAAHARAEVPVGQVERGIVVEPHFGLTAIGGGGGGVGAGLFGGYKLGRAMLGLTINLGYSSYSSSLDPSGITSQQMATVAILPGARLVLFRSDDKRFELFWQIDAGYSHGFQSIKSGAIGPTPFSSNGVPFDTGVGVRVWVHPRWAVAASALLQGSWSSTTYDVSPTTQSTTSGAGFSIGGALQIAGVI